MRFPAPIAAPFLAAGLACAAGHASHAATLSVAVNHSLRLPVSGRAASVVVGNASIADVTVVDSHTLFVTGKAAGSTDVAVVDPLGRTVFAADVAVSATAGRPVTVHRASDTAELSCDPRCLAPAATGATSTAAVSPPMNPGVFAGGMIGSAIGGALAGGASAAPPAPVAPAR